MSEHSELPWKLHDFVNFARGLRSLPIEDADGYIVADAEFLSDCPGSPERAKANATFIVSACNSHDQLVQAVKDLRSFEYHRGDLIHQGWLAERCLCAECIEKRADAALKLAEDR